MKNKFSKSNIEIRGELTLNIHHPQDGFKLCYNEEKRILLTGLKYSKSGVYCLRNKLNGRLYIGSTKNLEVRQKRHFRDLKCGEHCNNVLYQEYLLFCGDKSINDYVKPEDIFEFEVIIYCRPSELTFYEHLLIKYLNPYYNIHKEKEIKFDVFSDDNL